MVQAEQTGAHDELGRSTADYLALMGQFTGTLLTDLSSSEAHAALEDA